MHVRRRWAVGLMTILVSLTACGQDESLGLDGSNSQHQGLERHNFRNCTLTPFTPAEPEGFSSWANRFKTKVAARHSTQDIIALPGTDVTLHETFAYGLIGWRLASEKVNVYTNDCATWQTHGTQQTNLLGELEIPFATADLGIGQFSVLANVLGDGSVMESAVRMIPEGTRFVVLDIDGTLSTRSNDMLRNVAADMYWHIAKHDYTPQPRIDAAAMTHKWHEKGYLILYLTGRPKLLRQDTLDWLKEFGFAPGTLHMTEHRVELLPRIVGVGTYKAKYLEHLTEMGYVFDYAYGDATTDLYAFKHAGIPRENTYYLGTEMFSDGARMIEEGTYTKHLQDMDALPDATQPFQMTAGRMPN